MVDFGSNEYPFGIAAFGRFDTNPSLSAKLMR
jgi:hypothetical protein